MDDFGCVLKLPLDEVLRLQADKQAESRAKWQAKKAFHQPHAAASASMAEDNY
jgi:hypothetical protein